MKITCAKRSRDDIIKDRDAYDAKKKQIHDTYDSQYRDYRNALNSVYESVRYQVADELSEFNSLNLDIYVSESFRGGLEVKVYSNERNVHSEHKALSWQWTAHLTEDGEVKKESGSWSGLNAVTSEQIESLKQSVACLEVLNNLDWAKILSRDLPEFKDYITVNTYDVDRNRPDFEQELLESEIDEAISSGSFIKGHGYYYYGKRATVYYRVLKETPKQYLVEEIWENDIGDERRYPAPYKISKEKFFQTIVQPIELFEE